MPITLVAVFTILDRRFFSSTKRLPQQETRQNVKMDSTEDLESRICFLSLFKVSVFAEGTVSAGPAGKLQLCSGQSSGSYP